MVSVDVVVVSYNSRDRLRACVEPLCAVDWIHAVVVDNASRDDSLAVIAGLPVEAVQSGRNGGFAFGCNAGIARGRAPYVLLLNPDATIAPADLARLAGILAQEPGAGAVGPRIVTDDGGPDPSRRRFPTLRATFARAVFLNQLLPRSAWTDERMRDPAGYAVPGTADWLSGACLLVRRDVLDGLGGLDEGFILYCEDTDLCRRIWSLGLSVRYEPSAICRHEGGASAPRPSLFGILAESRVRYARKHRARPAAMLERIGVALEAATHAIVSRGGLPQRAGHLRALRGALLAARGARPVWPPARAPR